MIEDGRVYLTARIVGGRVVTVLNVSPEHVPTYPPHFNSPASIIDDPDNPVDINYS